MDPKAEQLQSYLDQLSPAEALALARAVELQRVNGEEKLPGDAIMTKLRPQLRKLRPARIPTLCRLACDGFAAFLSDRDDDPRLPGLIPRSIIKPWWRALVHVSGTVIYEREAQLRVYVAERNERAIDALRVEIQALAADWTLKLTADLRKPKGDAGLKPLFPRGLMLADLDEIAQLLGIAQPLNAALEPILTHLRDFRRLEPDGRIRDLTSEAVTAAKQHYQRLSEAHGLKSRYLALALLNRLAQPWHIMRLGRALSWKPNDALVRDTEFGLIGQRLILDLQRLSRDIVIASETRGQAPDCALLTQRVAHYISEAEGLLGEFGFRRDSAWGEAILQSRNAAASALDRNFLDRVALSVLNLMPMNKRSGMGRGRGETPDTSWAPDPTAIEAATHAAKFLMLLMQKGARHGLAHAAHESLDQLGQDIEERAVDLYEELKQAPDNRAVVAQIEAAAAMCEILYDDNRGALLTRRMQLARRKQA